MKAFVAVALLVACVAAQTTFDRNTLLKNVRVNRFDVNRYDVPEVRTTYPWDMDTTTYYYTLEELVRTPLFQQYYTLPLFRQHFTHPLFQHYLTTPAFQKYWIHEEFQTFFKNPVLFYKYIFPVVFTTTTTTTPWGTNNVWNKDVITPTTVWDILGMRNTMMNKQYPTIVNQYNKVPVEWTKVEYFNMLDKLVKPVDVTEVDVKVVKPIVEKIVDPMTGEVKYVYGDNKIVGDNQMIRNTVDKYITVPRREVMTPFFYNRQVNTPMYNRDLITKDDIFRQYYNTESTVVPRDLLKEELIKKIFLNTPVDRRDLINVELLKKFINTIPVEILNNRDLVNEEILKKFISTIPVETLMNRDLVKEELLKKFINTIPVEKMMNRDLVNEEILKKFIYSTPVETMMNRDLVKEELLKKFFTETPIDTLVSDKYNNYYNIPVETMDKDALKKFYFNLPVDTMTKDDLLKKFLINKLPVDNTLVKDNLFQKYLIQNTELPTMMKEELIKKINNQIPITKDDLIMNKQFFPTVVLGDRPMVAKTFDEKMNEQKIVKDELINKIARENIIA